MSDFTAAVLITLAVEMFGFMIFGESCNKRINTARDSAPEVFEKRVVEGYTNWANSHNWYIGDKHLEPFSKLSTEEQNIWKSAMKNCGHLEKVK